MASEQITVRASIRRRVRHDEPIPAEIRWDEETADTYETARDAIRDRIPEGELITARYVDR